MNSVVIFAPHESLRAFHQDYLSNCKTEVLSESERDRYSMKVTLVLQTNAMCREIVAYPVLAPLELRTGHTSRNLDPNAGSTTVSA